MARHQGKTALITGGTTGIGLETAKQYLAEGAKVMITGTNEERLVTAIAQLGKNATSVRADVRSLKDLDNLAKEVKQEFGSLDILFANAGIGYFAAIEDIDEASYDNQFDINVKGVFFTVQKLVGLLNENSSIILNASAVNEKGAPMGSLYFASKAAVRSLARSLAAELAPRKVRVNALSPGIVRTSFQSKLDLPAQAVERFVDYVKNSTPLGREGSPEEIAKAAVFLASDDSSYMTAADIVVDGGYMNV